jgi:hypothetical protein
MPVAKLSREFYERFGDKVTDELVNCLNTIEAGYRSELNDLFDAHFGRFEELYERRPRRRRLTSRVVFNLNETAVSHPDPAGGPIER